jgi:hypothetical protein
MPGNTWPWTIRRDLGAWRPSADGSAGELNGRHLQLWLTERSWPYLRRFAETRLPARDRGRIGARKSCLHKLRKC